MELHAHWHTLGIEVGTGLIPGDIADGVGAQVRRIFAVVQHFTDKTEAAIGEGEDTV